MGSLTGLRYWISLGQEHVNILGSLVRVVDGEVNMSKVYPLLWVLSLGPL